MARGRIVNAKICMDKDVHALSCDTSRLAYTWTIPHLDREGRMYGDPALVKSMIFPRRIDVTIEQMQQYITDWVKNGLVIRYVVDGEPYLYFPGFEKNQPGLRKDREPESLIPSPEEGEIQDEPEDIQDVTAEEDTTDNIDDGKHPANIRQTSGSNPENIPPKRREEKRREENTTCRGKLPAAVRQSLYQKINAAFLSKNGDKFTNYQKEGQAIKQLITKARARSPDDPEEFIRAVIVRFWEMKNGKDKFWSKQPFLPSALNASGIFDRVLETFREDQAEMREMSDEDFEQLLQEATL
jgi:hypothetical protein